MGALETQINQKPCKLRKRKQAGKINKTEVNMLVEKSGRSQGREQILLKGRHLGFYEGPPFSLGLGHRWAVFILRAYLELCSMWQNTDNFRDTGNLVTATRGQQWTRKYHLESSSQPGFHVKGTVRDRQGSDSSRCVCQAQDFYRMFYSSKTSHNRERYGVTLLRIRKTL